MFLKKVSFETMRFLLKRSYFAALLLAAIAGAGYGQTVASQLSASAAARFLDQATWGPTPASIAQLQQMGIPNWLKAHAWTEQKTSSSLETQALGRHI